MRRIFSFVLYAGMILAGAVAFGHFLQSGGRGVVFVAGGFLAAFGAYLMWIDFLSPNRTRT
jgi:hypothetical protein